MKLTLVVDAEVFFPPGLPGAPGPVRERLANTRKADLSKADVVAVLRNAADRIERERAR